MNSLIWFCANWQKIKKLWLWMNLSSCLMIFSQGVLSKVGGWDMNEPTSEWRKDYGPKIFCGENISFDFVPMNVPPFFQSNNYLEEESKILPMPILDKLLF
jgi:hypothetical protein